MPEAGADKDHGCSAEVVLVSRERTPDDRLNTQYREKRCGNHLADHSLGLAVTGQIEIVRAISGHGLEGSVVLLPIEEVEIGNGCLRELCGLLIERDEPLRLRIWQRV